MARRLGIAEEDVEDVVQDTFLVFFRRIDTYDPSMPIRQWLLGIVKRVAMDHRRRYQRKDSPCVPHPEDSERAIPSAAPLPSQDAEQSQALRLLNKLIATLDDDKREVLVLAQIEELTVPEISELLGLNVNTVYARLRAARRAFDSAYARYQARQEHEQQKRGIRE
jgi:RNA polymerase sigma-70 factor (ECF subfamily)